MDDAERLPSFAGPARELNSGASTVLAQSIVPASLIARHRLQHFSDLAGSMIVRLQKTSQESCDGGEARLAFGELRQSL